MRDKLGRFVGKKKEVNKCEYCGNSFLDYSSANRKFCSKKCLNDYNKIRYSGGGNPFYGKTHKEDVIKVISEKKFKTPIEQRIINNCIICEKPIKKSRNESWKDYEKHRFCSRKCSSKYNAPFTSPFKRGFTPWNKNKTGLIISHRRGLTFEEEYGEERAKEIKEKISIGILKLEKVGYNKVVEGIHLSPKTEFKIGHKLSSESILKIKENWNSPKKIEFAKERRAKQILPIKDTSIEIKIQNFLKELGIEFFTHQYMHIEHGYQCDILIPSMNLVIECDGIYWHKYPVGNDIDHIRTKELIEKGFKVLRLWEFEIKKMDLNGFNNILKGGTTNVIV